MSIELKHNISLSIATGKSRKEINWLNREWSWEKLVKRLSHTHTTAESHNEYMKADKSRQDEIKDIGGFVGGYIANGKRKKENITFRSLIALDLDYAKLDFFDDYKLIYGYAACVYSTHKHTAEKPRFRLIIPLADTIPSDQYEPVARKIAEWVGIEMFDDTTYQAERLMYWPSTSNDAEYYFDYCDGEFLNAEDVLNQYYDWTDISSWPRSSRVDKIIERAIKKQEDPHEKKGVVGAFCRAYSITEAIDTFLTDVYSPCAEDNRYTYIKGSTSAGLVIYDDIFAFSHHGTDPISGKLCNAFDLVRVHRFGHMDENAKEDTPTNRLPSYKRMGEFITEDSKAKKLIIKEQLEKAAEDFDGIDIDTILNGDEEWIDRLETNENGKIKSTIDNVILILDNDPNIMKTVGYNAFEKMVVMMRDLPWRKYNPRDNYFTDTDESGFRHYLEKCYGITGAQKIKDGIDLVTRQNTFHPVKTYLDKLKWDGVERLESVFIDYLGAEDSPYIRAVTRKALTACVARVYAPGCKFDSVLTLIGPQGIGKSTILRKLGGEWHNESVTLFNITKETADLIQGSWIIELGELVGFKKAEEETIKNFISRTEDKYRKAYGRNTEKFPRQCVFFGTTNERLFLKDPTGNRRWWPVDTGASKPTKSVFKDLDHEDVDQIWAEAKEAFNAGESLYLANQLYDYAVGVQEEHNEFNEKIGIIEKYLETPIPDDWEDLSIYDKREYLNREKDDSRWDEVDVKPRERVCVAAIWCECFGGDLKNLRKLDSSDIMRCMRKIKGWEEHKSTMRFKDYGTQKGFKKN